MSLRKKKQIQQRKFQFVQTIHSKKLQYLLFDLKKHLN